MPRARYRWRMVPKLTWPQPDGTYCKLGDFSSARPDVLYAAWLDPALMSKAIAGVAAIEPAVGGAYRLGKRLTGSIAHLQPSTRIVLALRGPALPKSAPSTHAFIDIADHGEGSQVDLAHVGLPSMKVALAYVDLWRGWVRAVCEAAARLRAKRPAKR